MGVSRRAVIIGSGIAGVVAGLGGWALLADARLVPGRSLIDDALGRCDQTGSPPPEATPGRLVRSSFYSEHRRQSVNYVLSYPPNVAAGARLPVCLALHGLGENERSPFDGMAYHRLLAAAVTGPDKVPAFVLAAVSGGDRYWHPRHDDDPLGMLLDDFPRVLAQHGLRADHFAILGWSMGGFGALLAALEAPERFIAVVANAPAFWPSYDDANKVNATAFDSADDWSRYGDLLARAQRIGALPNLRIDCGESDPFAPVISELRHDLPDPGVVHFAPGCHDGDFWRSVASAQLRLIGNAFKSTTH